MVLLYRLLGYFLFAALAFGQVAQPTLPQLTVNTDLSFSPVTGKSIAVPAGGDLQAAINSANPGDEIVLQAGAIYHGNFELPAKTGIGWVTIRSSAMSSLPMPGNRVSLSDAVNMATIQAAGVSTAFHLSPKASHYRLIGLEITTEPKQYLSYGLIMQGDPNDADPTDLPSYITIDRCYLHGRPLEHIKFGWQMNGSYLAIVDSYVSEFHGLGQDTQAITGYMGTGPLKITNNFLEAAGENILFGGAYDAIPGVTTADVTFTGNYLYKPPTWFWNSIVPAPANVAVAPSAAGNLAPGTYYYFIIAQGTVGTLNSLPGQAQSSRSAEASVTLSSTQSAATITWTEQNYGDSQDTRLADNYVIARTQDAPGASTRNWTYFSYTPAAGSVSMKLTDSGSMTPLSGYGEWARVWSVKNLFEIKNGVRWLVEKNVMEGNWVSSQNGFSVLLTPRNEWPYFMAGNRVTDIIFRNNIIKHVAGGINIGSEDDTVDPSVASQLIQTARIAVVNNLWQISYNWGGNGIAMQFGAGPFGLPGATDLQFIHNTTLQTWSNAGIGNTNGTAINRIGNFLYRDNILQNGPYGWHINGMGSDWASISSQFTSISVDHNVWAGAPWNAQYAGNYFPADLNAVGFVKFTDIDQDGDFHLAATSAYKGLASDGTDPGANVDSLNTMAALATGGQTYVPPAPAPVPVTVPPVTSPAPAAPAVPASLSPWFEIVNQQSSKCLTALTSGLLAQSTCSASNTAQQFSLQPVAVDKTGAVLYEITSHSAGSQADVWGVSTANGAKIGLYPYQASANEQFKIALGSTGTFSIVASHSGSCFDMPLEGISSDGTVLQQWQCYASSKNQQWTLSLVALQ